MKYFKTKTVCAALLAATLAGCATDEYDVEWTPGPIYDNAGVFIDAPESLISVMVGEPTQVSIPVKRSDIKGDLTVPLIVDCANPDVVIPQSVSFKDGSDETALTFDIAKLNVKELTPLTITVPAEYASPYTVGTTAFMGNLILSDWDEVPGSPLTFQWYDFSYNASTAFDPFEQRVFNLGGTNRYRINDFMGTGINFKFELQESPYEGWKGYYRIMPLDNQVLWSAYEWEYYYNPWWLVDNSTGEPEWPEITLYTRGNPKTYYGLSFFWYDDDYQTEYCFVRRQGTENASGIVANYNSAYMGMWAYATEDWDWSYYTGFYSLYFEWTDPEESSDSAE